MKKIIVEVCSCSKCVMMGSMDIISSIESLKKLKSQLRLHAQIEIVECKCIGPCRDRDCSPVVRINGKELTNATSEVVMSNIIALTAKDVK